jgi:RNA recognition motif-containing protein
MAGKIYVGNLNYEVPEQELRDAFAKHGKISSLTMKQGFAFVEFETERDAEVCGTLFDQND